MADPSHGRRLSIVTASDCDTLARLGKKEVLKRRFGFWSLFAFAACELITWEVSTRLLIQVQ
jgi:choline transport protein